MNPKEVVKTLEIAKAEVEWNYPMDYAVAIDEAIEAVGKQIPENGFKNECGCIVDYELLYRAIDKKCRSKNCYCHNKYRIFLHNSYPSVCINREKYYVHILVGEMIYGNIRKGYVIHHKDKNKLNALPQNLELMSIYKHNKLHAEERKGLDFRSENGKKNSINALRDARIRKDVTKGKIEELRRQGLTIQEISEVLNCGINTVYRRLEIKA